MKIIIAALIIFCVVVFVWAAVVVALKWAQRQRLSRAPWTLEEESDKETKRLHLYLTKPGQDPQEVLHPETAENGVSFKSPNFDMDLYLLRSEAERQLEVLNDRD